MIYQAICCLHQRRNQTDWLRMELDLGFGEGQLNVFYHGLLRPLGFRLSVRIGSECVNPYLFASSRVELNSSHCPFWKLEIAGSRAISATNYRSQTGPALPLNQNIKGPVQWKIAFSYYFLLFLLGSLMHFEFFMVSVPLVSVTADYWSADLAPHLKGIIKSL